MELSVYFRCIFVVMGALFPPYLSAYHRPGDAQISEYIAVGEVTFPHPIVAASISDCSLLCFHPEKGVSLAASF